MDKLAYIVRELLVRDGKALLPGLGILTLQRTGASIDTGRQVIQPPKDELDFLASENIGEEHLLNQLKELSLPAHVNLSDLASSISSGIRELTQKDEFRIGDFVQFIKSEEGDYTIKTLPENTLSPISNLDELTLPAAVGVKTMEKVATAAAVSEDAAPVEKEKQNWKMPALITAIILLLSFTIWWFTPEWKNGSEAFSKLLVKEERVNISPSEVKPKAVDSPVEQKEIVPEPDALDSPAFEKDVTAEEDTVDSVIAQEKQDEETSISDEDHKTVSSDCVIVVGSFSRTSNVERMKTELKSRGHRIFTQNINGLTRVGLYAPCAPRPLDSTLTETRENIESNAWLLE